MADKKKISLPWLLLLIAAVAVLLCSGVYIVSELAGRELSEQERAQFTQTTAQEQTKIANPIDFEALQQINPDVYAWIKIDNTNVDYPIAQASMESDSFYLDHNYKKQSDSLGCIYTEKQNARDFSDPNTLVYGHNTWSGEMFYTLYNFKEKNFFDENEFIYIYTPGHILTYRVYAAYEYDNRHILNSFNLKNEQIFYDYLQTTLAPTSLVKNVRSGVTLTKSDRIITLSTCMKNLPNSRYLVQGVLIKDEPTE